ncbi:CBS domain-containing protein [Allokutzneria albata]|uniref:CBS domain-containing protein n=1 Tax=Allokutzneria albata TaxID=211114 RepID=A0A1G9SK04_ALLAB|nr:CBS domain-containing protein [Allokutzneria albata]SDM35627.1 CBS domain-containing protein [Allokutzneria albata]
MRKPTVRSVMTTDVITTTPRTPFAHAVGLMVKHGVSALPVVDASGVLVGVVSEADLLDKEACRRGPRTALDGWLRRRARQRARARTVGGAMTAWPETIDADLDVSTAADRLARSGHRRLFVVDDRGRLIGVLARRDLLRPFLRTDAELAAELEREIFERTLWADMSTVRVLVRDGVVTLAGRVDGRAGAELAVDLAKAMPGVVDVQDELEYDSDEWAEHPR